MTRTEVAIIALLVVVGFSAAAGELDRQDREMEKSHAEERRVLLSTQPDTAGPVDRRVCLDQVCCESKSGALRIYSEVPRGVRIPDQQEPRVESVGIGSLEAWPVDP